MHFLPSLDQQAPETPSIFQDNSALVCVFHVGSGAGVGIGMDQVVLAGAGIGTGPGYGLLWSSKMSLPYFQ